MTAHTTRDDDTTAEQGPTTVRLDDLRDRADDLVEDDTTEFESRSDLIREGVRRLVTEAECRRRLTVQGVSGGETETEDVPANLDPVVDRAADHTHPLRADGSGESA